MRWKPGVRSEDVEDVRDESGGGGFRLRGPHLGIGGFLVLLVLSLVLKRDFVSLLGVADVASPLAATTPVAPSHPDTDRVRRVSVSRDGPLSRASRNTHGGATAQA
jgi:predicted metalloprotease